MVHSWTPLTVEAEKEDGEDDGGRDQRDDESLRYFFEDGHDVEARFLIECDVAAFGSS